MVSVRLEEMVDEAELAPQAQSRSGCCHYWVIDSPGGPLSPGVCKYCGSQKQFVNAVPMKEYHKRTDRVGEGVADVKTYSPVIAAIPETVYT